VTAPSVVPPPSLGQLRRRLTAWYAVVFSVILLLLGGGLYVEIHEQIARELDNSLRSATAELVRAARIREMERRDARGTVVDAVEELRVPDRMLYLLDSAGRAISPRAVPAWVASGAQRAMSTGSFDDEIGIGHDHSLSLHAERFRLESGQRLVAIAVADQLELAERFASLIAAFLGAAIAAVVLVLAGGYVMVRKSTVPIERSMAYMRRFMADAAHELRTPVAVLRTRAEVALQSPRSAEAYVAALQGMSGEAQRLGRVVDDLLTLARADAGERPVAHERFFLDDVALDAALSVRTLAQAADVALVVEKFEEAAVLGDAMLVRELIVILLDNAVKFTPAGGTVRVRVHSEPQPTLDVEDTGIGIAAAQLPHVFERFYRGDVARPRSGGAGLGLAIAQWIATAHGARLSLESRPGEGTHAHVLFPTPAAPPPTAP
jgi:signal transduction histidine kinase